MDTLTSTELHLYATDKLKQARQALGYLQRDMAQLVKLNSGRRMNRQYYQQIEDATKPVDAQQAIIISRILKADIDVLFTKGDAP